MCVGLWIPHQGILINLWLKQRRRCMVIAKQEAQSQNLPCAREPCGLTLFIIFLSAIDSIIYF